jgi:hypothetical protein
MDNANKSKIEHNNTKPGLCRKGGSYTHDKDGKLVAGPKDKPAKKETKKTVKDEDGGK